MIIHGDCLAVLAANPDWRFRLVIADPPYNIGKKFSKDNRDLMPMDRWVQWCIKWMDKCRDRLTEDGVMYCYGYPEYLCRVASCYEPHEQRWLQWHYTSRVAGGFEWFQRAHESILALWRKDCKRPNLEIDAIRRPYKETSIQRGQYDAYSSFRGSKTEVDWKPNPLGALPVDVIEEPLVNLGRAQAEGWCWCDTCQDAYTWNEYDGGHREHETWTHPTVKPLSVTKTLVQSVFGTSGIGKGMAFIPFGGSGSECAVCKTLGVEWRAAEIEAKFVRLIERRIAKTQPGLI